MDGCTDGWMGGWHGLTQSRQTLDCFDATMSTCKKTDNYQVYLVYHLTLAC